MGDEIKIEFTKAEMLEAIATKIAAKNEAPGADDHEFVFDMCKAANAVARRDHIDVFSAASRAVVEDPKLGQRWLAYVFEQ